VQGVEQAQPQANANRGHAERASKVAEHLAHERIELVFIELRHRDSPSLIALDF